MSRAHAEITHQIRRLGQLIADIGPADPDDADLADLRSLLYGLHAILRLHTAQEDESYLSLGDDPGAAAPRTAHAPRRPRTSAGAGRRPAGHRAETPPRPGIYRSDSVLRECPAPQPAVITIAAARYRPGPMPAPAGRCPAGRGW